MVGLLVVLCVPLLLPVDLGDAWTLSRSPCNTSFSNTHSRTPSSRQAADPTIRAALQSCSGSDWYEHTGAKVFVAVHLPMVASRHKDGAVMCIFYVGDELAAAHR